jgi:hypothetical protein
MFGDNAKSGVKRDVIRVTFVGVKVTYCFSHLVTPAMGAQAPERRALPIWCDCHASDQLAPS